MFFSFFFNYDFSYYLLLVYNVLPQNIFLLTSHFLVFEFLQVFLFFGPGESDISIFTAIYGLSYLAFVFLLRMFCFKVFTCHHFGNFFLLFLFKFSNTMFIVVSDLIG
jgi:hypothetical protein